MSNTDNNDCSQLDDPTLWLDSTVHLWYQRENSEDFTVSICYDNGYKIVTNDNDSRDPTHNEHVFTKFEHLREYLRMLHRQVLNDNDPHNRFTYFQHGIPFFPSVLLPIGYIRTHPENYFYFMDALELFFRF